MRQYVIIASFGILFCCRALAQDILILQSGEVVEVAIVAETQEQVTFIKWLDPKRRQLILPRSAIKEIAYREEEVRVDSVAVIGIDTVCNGQQLRMQPRLFSFGFRYYIEEYRVSQQKFESVFRQNSEAYDLYLNAKRHNVNAEWTGRISGFVLGWHIGTRLAGGETNDTVFALSGLVSLISLFSRATSFKRLAVALDTYNDGIMDNLSLGVNNYGLGLSYTF